MKSCPACQRSYADDALSFCLDDGSPLVAGDALGGEPAATMRIPAARLTNQTPTEVLRTESPPSVRAAPVAPPYQQPAIGAAQRQKQSPLPWILGAALVLGLSAIAVAWIVTRNGATQRAAAEPIPTPSQSPDTANTGDPVPTPPDRVTEPSPPGLGNPKTSRGIGEGTGPGPVIVPSTVPESPPPPAPTPLRPRAPISGGVLNGRAISKPVPAYPAITKAARASGTVSVQVTIDESGKVISATAISGHPLLQQSAAQAARQARFTPTLLSGQPVKVMGVLTYNFVLP